MLSDGQSSRIYKKLVYDKQLALAAFGGGNIIEHPNLFFAVAIVHPGKSPDEAVDTLIAELDRLRSEPITAAELQQAKNQFARDYISSRESNKDKASHLGHAVVIDDDIKTADGEFDIFMNITAADVQRVAKTVLHARESPRDEDHAEGDPMRPTTTPLVVAAICLSAMPVLAQVRDWPTERPPRPMDARDVSSRCIRCGR